jgi:hypothetical protein
MVGSADEPSLVILAILVSLFHRVVFVNVSASGLTGLPAVVTSALSSHILSVASNDPSMALNQLLAIS